MRVSSSPGALYAPGPPVRSGSQRLCTRERLVERTVRVLGMAQLDSILQCWRGLARKQRGWAPALARRLTGIMAAV
jgi:hypothetical protein